MVDYPARNVFTPTKHRCAAKGGGASGFTSGKPGLRYCITEWNVFDIANTVVTRTNNPLETFNRERNTAFKHHPNLRQFVATIARMSSAYAQRQSNITHGLRRKKQRPPLIQLPIAPALASFTVPSGSEDEYGEEVAYQSDDYLESVCSGEEEASSLGDGDGPDDAGSVDNVAQEIDEYADTYDFSLSSGTATRTTARGMI
ncbi:hypothetical protein JG687_00014305 [Phytophthora cactorum]|uniref:Uncharacterized protein n=2 Tax=Phytophthora cactorum TaxID=29920 RepID=A0A8T1U171_9STRA|nr:hypothetical protein JG687_00014305 [Phytophthora cactorum]